MYELWKSGALDFSAMFLQVYRDLGLAETEYVFFVVLAGALKSNPTHWKPSDLAGFMTIGEDGVARLFMEGLTAGHIEVRRLSDEGGRRYEEYSLAPLFGKIEAAGMQKNRQSTADSRTELFKHLERHFGLLSPKDIETAHMWLDDDGFDPEIVKLALTEMENNQITSIKYVDRILLDWKKKNVRTLDEAKRQMIDFRNRKAHQAPVPSSSGANPEDYYDWMSEI